MTTIAFSLPSAVVFCASAYSAVKSALFQKQQDEDAATMSTSNMDLLDCFAYNDDLQQQIAQDDASIAYEQYFSYGARIVASRV